MDIQTAKDVRKSERLNPRYVVNVGKNIITIKPDKTQKFFLKRFGQTLVDEITLNPGESAYLKNFCVILWSNDGTLCHLYESFNEKGLEKLLNHYKSGKFENLPLHFA
jgi:hypothetical protein